MPVDLWTLDDLDVEGRRVLVRVDTSNAVSAEDSPSLAQLDLGLRSALTTVDELRRRGASVVLIGDRSDPRASMRPIAERLSRLTGEPVPLAPGVVGQGVREAADRLLPGQMLMLENVGGLPGETRCDPELAVALAELGDLYVNDAFRIAHERRASTWGVAQHLHASAGRALEREIYALTAVIVRPIRPEVVVLGGLWSPSKIGMLSRMLIRSEVVCLGGALAGPFLAAQGQSVGAAGWHPEQVEIARTLLASDRLARLVVPLDLVAATASDLSNSVPISLRGAEVPPGMIALDIGSRTSHLYGREVFRGATVLWHGPMGRFEQAGFGSGTRALAGAVASASATTIVAGAATARALNAFGLVDRIGHLSVGGPAMLALLQGRELPGVEVLLRTAVQCTT